LQISAEARYKMRIQELKRMQPGNQNKLKQKIDLACIYLGIDNIQNKPYIGQTSGNPESRWKEHRNICSGPFKNGAKYATWKILEESVPPSKLNKLEAYYIGLYDAYENGHNDNTGNDWEAYERGKRNLYKL
jgi:hypothetical protein